MGKSHIAFIAYSAQPSIGPILPILNVLARRGHRISCVVTEQYAERFSVVDATVISCSDVPVWTSGDGETDSQGNYQDSLTRLSDAALDVALPVYKADRPALVIYYFAALAGQIISSRLRVSAIRASACFAHSPEVFSDQVRDPAFRQQLLGWSRNIDTYLKRQGIRESNWHFHKEKLNLFLFPRDLQPRAEVFGAEFFYAGRCPGEQFHYGKWRPPSQMERLVLVTTSTLYVQGPSYFRMCIHALSDYPWRVVLSIGELADAASIGDLPTNCEIVQKVSHVTILPYVDVMLCLGGIITTSEAVYHGVPMVVTSHGMPELEYQAENLVRLGLCIHVPKDHMDINSIRRAVVEASEDRGMRARVIAMQKVMRRDVGAEEAGTRIEQYLEESEAGPAIG